MSDYYRLPLAYYDIAKCDGEEAAQALWIKNGGTGKYVPGMTAVAAMWDKDGAVTIGKTEPYRF